MTFINYKDNKYDFQSIEEELSKILLSEKRLFLNEQYQDFITYAYEGFNQNESIILDFKGKIKTPQPLTELDKINMTYYMENTDYNLILFNFQSLFLYFINKRNINGNEILIDEINNVPFKIINLDEVFIDLFRNFPNIKLNQMIDCYEYIESLNINEIIKKIPKSAKIAMTTDQLIKFDQHFNNNNNLLITKKELSEVVRKFISRFLVSERFNHFEWNLIYMLELKDKLWSDNFINEKNKIKFDEEMDILKLFNIEIKHSLSFYYKLKNININDNDKIVNTKHNNNEGNTNKIFIIDDDNNNDSNIPININIIEKTIKTSIDNNDDLILNDNDDKNNININIINDNDDIVMVENNNTRNNNINIKDNNDDDIIVVENYKNRKKRKYS
ncbi:hypothetical protein PIROE2DRAFT_9776 [Piromyces sp. E2]|nr:hypothetical protein PIROE2DRAFT_9776 [Piromyces sp. E2]|eukprot:OUM63632.1 hypothetical protein PIROE2DRAFT_9776 [Piromyces sp. E2]